MRLHAGNSDVYLMSADGSHPRNLTRSGSGDAFPRWSPDGKRIAYTHVDASGVYDIFVIDPASGKRRRLTLAAQAVGPVWSPDGDMIAFEKVGEIWVMRSDGTHMRRLTNQRASDGNPAWSPDGSQIAFNSNRGGNLAAFTGFGLFVMDADGLHQRRLSYGNGEEGAPAWSPNGRRIAFSSTRDGDSEIYVMATDGNDQRRLTRTLPSTDTRPGRRTGAASRF